MKVSYFLFVQDDTAFDGASEIYCGNQQVGLQDRGLAVYSVKTAGCMKKQVANQ